MDEIECVCICGNKMKYIQSRLAYTGSNGVKCDGCHKLFEKQEMMYNCPKNEYHQDASRTSTIPTTKQIGYDLCEECANIKICNNTDNINCTIKNITNILNNKTNEFKNIIINNNSIVKHNKFISNIIDKTIDDNKNDDIITNESLHHFSHRFFYWDKQKTMTKDDRLFPGYKISDGYVSNKHINLKTELLENTICCINIKIWQYINNRSKKYLESSYIKSRKPNLPWTVGTFPHLIKNMSLNHLMCIMFYCDYNQLSNYLLLSFKYSSKLKTLKQLKNYHSNFYWFARHLNELVQSFGIMTWSKDTNKYFYHGISEPIIFNTTNLIFTHPLSATKRLEVIQYFCSLNKSNNNGIILKLGVQRQFTSFNCSFISSFTNQNEYLIMTGYDRLYIQSIINYKNCIDYRKYLNAINIFTSLINGQQLKVYVTDSIELILKSLINKNSNDDNNDNIPQYVHLMFNQCMHHIKAIIIHFDNISNIKYG
eukprot:333440_1